MIITSRIPKGKTRCTITTDGGESFTVSVRDARLYGLEEGAEISASVLSLIREQLRKEILRESGSLLGVFRFMEAAAARQGTTTMASRAH